MWYVSKIIELGLDHTPSNRVLQYLRA